MSAPRRSSMMALLCIALLAACGSDPADSTATSTTPPSTTPPSTTPPATTPPPATTVPATTVPPTTTAPAVPAGWSEIDADQLPSKAFPPCCGDDWHGDVSPPLTPEGEPLADGVYAVAMQWPDDPTQPLELELHRFEQCALLPEFSCGSLPEGVEYNADQLGIDTSGSRPLTVPLDDQVRVVVVGWDDDSPEGARGLIEQANGSDLAALAAEVDLAYAATFADRYAAGEDRDAIIADVLANPTGGFSPAVSAYQGFVFTPDSGPPLLFQSVFPYEDQERVAGRGTDVLAIPSIEVDDGEITVYIYAAYYP